jgi:hypothetical protein
MSALLQPASRRHPLRNRWATHQLQAVAVVAMRTLLGVAVGILRPWRRYSSSRGRTTMRAMPGVAQLGAYVSEIAESESDARSAVSVGHPGALHPFCGRRRASRNITTWTTHHISLPIYDLCTRLIYPPLFRPLCRKPRKKSTTTLVWAMKGPTMKLPCRLQSYRGTHNGMLTWTGMLPLRMMSQDDIQVALVPTR